MRKSLFICTTVMVLVLCIIIGVGRGQVLWPPQSHWLVRDVVFEEFKTTTIGMGRISIYVRARIDGEYTKHADDAYMRVGIVPRYDLAKNDTSKTGYNLENWTAVTGWIKCLPDSAPGYGNKVYSPCGPIHHYRF